MADNEAPKAPAAPDQSAGTMTSEEKTWGMLSHVSALAALTFIPFANIIGPLIVWSMKKDAMPFVMDQGKEALNFQITLTIAALIVMMPLSFMAANLPGGHYFAWAVGMLIFAGMAALAIQAGIKASNGEKARYPYSFKFIK